RIVVERRGVASFEQPRHAAQRLVPMALYAIQWQLDANEGKRVTAGAACLREFREQRVLRDAAEIDFRLFEVRAGVLQGDRHDLGTAAEVAVQIFQGAALAEAVDRQLVVRLPTLLPQQRLGKSDVGQGRGIG